MGLAVPILTQSKIDQLAQSENESAQIDFKSEFDTDSKKDWCEILKDIVAMANTRGGIIIVGVADDGQPSGSDLSKLSRIDPAKVTDKIASYTDVQFGDIRVVTVDRSGQRFPAIVVGRAATPLIFSSPGTYAVPGDKVKQTSAFTPGIVYVRHGAKSEPGTYDDLRQFIERRVELRIKQVAKRWRKGIRKVVTAPAGHEVQVVPPHMKLVPEADANEVRLVNDDKAPAARFLNPDATHPYRQKELIPEIAKRLGGKFKPSRHDIQCVRKVYETDNSPTFTYASKFGSRQYSAAFADWIVDQYKADPDFFTKACAENSRRLAANRVNKPR